jgi:hypothetical protein
MMGAPVVRSTRRYLLAHDRPDLEILKQINVAPNQTLSFGTIMAQVTAAVNDVQTLTPSGSPATGSITVAVIHPASGSTLTFVINAGDNAATVQAAAEVVLGKGNVAVSGGPLTGGAFTFTFQGALAGQPVQAMTIQTNALNQGNVAVTHTTTGASAGTYGKYDSSVNAAPTAGPTVAGNGAGSAFAAGTYACAYTLITAGGESTPSPETEVTITANQNLRFSAINSLDASVTQVGLYVDGGLVAKVNVSSGTMAQTDVTGSALTANAVPPPRTNTAYKAAAGLYNAKGILKYDIASDAAGQITSGAQTGGAYGTGHTSITTQISVAGSYRLVDLIGLDQKALTDLGGRLESGVIGGSAGVFRF